jgi:hypothetical protein
MKSAQVPDVRSASSGQKNFAVVAAVTGWAALLLQVGLTVALVVEQGRGWPMGLVIYFGFFTVLTNLLATLALSAWCIGPRFPGHRWLTGGVGLTSAASAITMVGLVYFFILRHTWQPQGAQFVADALLHYVMPVLFVIFWAWSVPPLTTTWAHVPKLLLYPLAYLVYVFARGEIVGLYPYAFIDVLKIGYPAALRNSVGLIAAYALITAIYLGLKSFLANPKKAPSAT